MESPKPADRGLTHAPRHFAVVALALGVFVAVLVALPRSGGSFVVPVILVLFVIAVATGALWAMSRSGRHAYPLGADDESPLGDTSEHSDSTA